MQIESTQSLLWIVCIGRGHWYSTCTGWRWQRSSTPGELAGATAAREEHEINAGMCVTE